jgi:diguanylate cyclase (GGDEF)-like protein
VLSSIGFLRNYLDRNDVEINTGTVLQLDIDNFKFINNTYGHEIGDEILKEVADRLLRHTDENQQLGRISGDEFVLICPNIHHRMEVDNCAQKLLSLFDEQFRIRDRSIYITVSIGIAVFPENGRDLNLLLNRAGTAVGIAKQNGKNRFEYYDVSMNDSMENRIFIQNNIRQAIKDEHFELHYQPLYDMKNNCIQGFEALVRWKDDMRGYISPLEFILVAEKMGLINRLGRWIMKEALSFAKRMSAEFGDQYYVSINVSTVQLIQQNFVDDLLDIVKEIGVSYHCFCIEITETALMQSFEKNASKLDVLKRLGVKISLDDFGTGYSSLSYLRRLPADVLKIDKTFIDEILNNNESKDLTEGIIVLAQKLGMEVIAEGVEKEAQLRQLKAYGCDGIQGYYIAKPMQEEHILSFIKDFEMRKEAFID